MRKLFVYVVFACAFMTVGTVFAESNSIWLTDFEQAKQEAKNKNLLILANFSGSDWCKWCKQLDEEVLSKPEFIEFAKKNFVLFLADFPVLKEQDAKIKNQNRALVDKYDKQVPGFPTILVLDYNGNVLANMGYEEGGAIKYIKHLEEILPSNKAKSTVKSNSNSTQKQ